MIFLKEFLQKVYFEEKISTQQKYYAKFPSGQRVIEFKDKEEPFLQPEITILVFKKVGNLCCAYTFELSTQFFFFMEEHEIKVI